MTTQDRKTIDEARIRALIDDRAKALRAKDVSGMLAVYAPDVVKFELPPPLQYAGAEATDAKRLGGWLATWKGEIGYEIKEVTLAVDDEVAFGHGLAHMHGPRTDGAKTDLWFRVTIGLRKIGGAWKVTHEHASVPFYMDGSYRAAVDLKP